MSGLAGSGRNAGLDALRFLLALAVLVYHYGWYGPATGALAPEAGGWDGLVWGRFAVPAFFVISGLVIARSVEDRTCRAFLAARFRRLWPAMAVCATLTLAVVLWAGAGDPEATARLWLMAVGLVPLAGSSQFLDDVYWSIAVELRFYGLMALLLLVSATGRAAALLTAMALAGFVAWFQGAPGWVLDTLLFPHAPWFAIGVLMARIGHGAPSPATVALLAANMLLAGVCAHVDFLRVDMMDGTRSPLWTGFAVAVVAVLLVAGALRLRLPPRLVRPAILAGAVSYPLYLIHQRAGYAVIGMLSDAGVPPVPAQAAAAIMAIAAAAAVIVLIERPVRAPAPVGGDRRAPLAPDRAAT